LRAKALSTNLSAILFPQHDPPTHKHLLSSLTLSHAGEYFRAARALAPFSPTPMSFDTTFALTTLHSESDGYFPFFLEDYELDQDFKLSSNSFKLTFQCMSHLSTSAPFGIIFEHLVNYFHPEDFASGFPQLFQLCFHIAQGHIPPQIACVFGVAHLLTMAKPSGGICSIAVGKHYIDSQAVFYVFNYVKLLQHTFPHTNLEFTTKGGYQAVIHGIKCTMDLHPNWVVLQLDVTNAFNSVSKGVIFLKLHAISGDIIQFIPFVHAFYTFESPLFYSHHNREGDVTIIPSAMGTLQSDPLGGSLFVLAHFRVLCFTASHFPSYLFPSIVNNTHIIGPPSIVSSTYEHF
jgi:hypothetical protein